MVVDLELWTAARCRLMTDINVYDRQISATRRHRKFEGYAELFPKTPENLELSDKRQLLVKELNEMTAAMYGGEHYLIWKLTRTG